MRQTFKFNLFFVFLACSITSLTSVAQIQNFQATSSVLWSENVLIPAGGRKNILNLNPADLEQLIYKGKIHTQIYPIEITGALPPLRPINNFFENRSSSFFQIILSTIGKAFTGLNSLDDILKNLGLHNYPEKTDIGVYSVPYPNEIRPDYRMGFGIINNHGTQGFTFSCAACHSSQLFGKTVLGLTNRFPRANDYFLKMKNLSPVLKPLIGTWVFNQVAGSTEPENKMILNTLNNLERVNVKKPLILGLDTSLAQVSLSLNKRSDDAWATPDQFKQIFPSEDIFLDQHPADSKPAVWWNLKYKNRWLSDGSVVSGNPIITNILWNEIGRGTDLKILNTWIKNNLKKIDELTAAIFSIEPPRITDFFTETELNNLNSNSNLSTITRLESAKNGEVIFNKTCAKCHGNYEKKWTEANTENLSYAELTQTTLVTYKPTTKVVDVGTDPNRYLGMKSLEQLNKLQISKDYAISVIAQKGYVPPPLVGIWSRWPYFHNNSAPNLCAVLTATNQRPKFYYAGAANDKNTDFDVECNGYPEGDKAPLEWKKDILFYDTNREGLHNTGHDEGIFLKGGQEILTSQDKKDLIRFLQTL